MREINKNAYTKYIGTEFVNIETARTFKENKNNRLENQKHIVELEEQMLNDFYALPPISVNTVTNDVIDGHHRLKAYLNLVGTGELDPTIYKLRVDYKEVKEEDELSAIIAANIYSKNWNNNDYINSYVQGKNPNYILLENWCRRHELTHTQTKKKEKCKYRYAGAIIKGKGCGKIIEEGLFTVTPEELKKADTIHDEMLAIINILEIRGSGQWLESFAKEWHRVRDFHTFKDWVKGIKNCRQILMKKPKSNGSDWREILSIVSGEITYAEKANMKK